MYYTPHQGCYFAHRITLEGLGDDALAQSLSTAVSGFHGLRITLEQALSLLLKSIASEDTRLPLLKQHHWAVAIVFDFMNPVLAPWRS